MPDAISMHEGLDSFAVTEVAVAMDPLLQRAVMRRWRGILAEATASSGVDEVAVIARVSDPSAWAETSEVRGSVTIGNASPEDKTTIVTGRIPVTRIEAVRQLGFVKSLKAARPLRPALASGIEETKARPDLLPAGTSSSGGQDVVIGVVDYGCDFAHRNFLTAIGKTRVRSIWHQGGTTTSQSPFGYGREYTSDEINAALSQPNPYAALGYGPAPDTALSKGTHGTHVLDICGGSGGGSGVAGFAPSAELVFVDVSHSDIPFAGPTVVGSSFGDSTQLLEAIKYIFDKAGSRPCVINISLGTNGGPHDGTTLVEQGIDRLLAAAPNRAVTIAASNAYDDGIHAGGRVVQGGTVDLSWRIPPGDWSDNECEVWYDAGDRISVELIAPGGSSLGSIKPGDNGTVSRDGAVQLFAANRLGDPNNGDNMIGIYLERNAPAGTWTIRLHGDTIGSGAFHAWIERDDSSPSSFEPPHDNTHTIGSISCGRLSIAVGSYDAHKATRPISWFSSAGPTRDGRQKPEISGPGHAVLAAHSRTLTGVTSKSGTSMAAPAVAGIVALVLGEARSRSLDLSAEDIRNIVIASARRSPPEGTGWEDRFGHGRIDAAAAVLAVIQRAQGNVPPVAASAPAAPRRRRTASAQGTSKARREGKKS
jgi:hypothetical protein